MEEENAFEIFPVEDNDVKKNKKLSSSIEIRFLHRSQLLIWNPWKHAKKTYYRDDHEIIYQNKSFIFSLQYIYFN